MKRNVELGFYLALALVLSYVESLIPFVTGVPGMKIGLPNLIVLLLLNESNNKNRIKEALIINVLRIILTGFLFGNLFSVIYSLSGAVFSFIIMVCAGRIKALSPAGVSILGGVFHNIGQLLTAMLVLESDYLLFYLGPLVIAGAITGLCLGTIVIAVRPYLAGRSAFN